MSGFGGALHFEDRRIEERLSAASDQPRQPARDAHGVRLWWDGRLDNGGDLRRLAVPNAARASDMQIVLAAYGRWGAECLPRLVGDFALAIWDALQQRLILARDCAGTRTLYYHCDSTSVIWSTDLRALVTAGDIPLEPDEEFVASLLAYEADPARSPFRNVHAARPAEVVTFSARGVCERRLFWTLDLDREIRRGSDEEYAEEFRALFREAVSVRLRTDGPLVAELSGGLDSSSIVAMADSIVADVAGVPRIETVSRVHEDARSSDERRFIEELERHRGRAGLHLTDAMCPLFEGLDDFARQLLPNPYCFAAAYHRAVDGWMYEMRSRVLLCGLGGDEIAGGRQSPMPELGDLLVTGHIGALLSRAAAWSSSLREPYVATIYRHAVKPLLPLRFRRRLAAERAASELTLYRPEYVERAELRDRLGAGLEPAIDGRPSARDQVAGFVTAVTQVANGFHQALYRGEIAYPFLHRPLVEFMQAIPANQKVRPGSTRIVQRAAMKGLLPDVILRRRSKGNPTEGFARGFRRCQRELSEWLLNGCVVKRGYADPVSIRTELSKLTLGTSKCLVPMLKLLSLELWFRALESRAHERRRPAIAADARGALRRGTAAAPEGDVTCSTA